MINGNKNTGAASGLTAAAGYAAECAEWNERQASFRHECAANISRYLTVNNSDLSEADRDFHRQSMAFESQEAERHERWAKGIREILSHTTEHTDASK